MRDTEDRFPELSLLNVLIALGLFDGPGLERTGPLLHFFEKARAGLFIASQLLGFFFVRILVHHTSRNFALKLQRDVGAWIVELIVLALGPFIKLGYVHHNLSFRIELDMGAIHRSRSRPFKIDRLAIVPAAMTGTLKLVLTGFPVRRAAEMRAARVDHKNPIGSFVYPDAILLLPLGVNAKRVICRKAHFKLAGWFKNGARQEKSKEHQKVGHQKNDHA